MRSRRVPGGETEADAMSCPSTEEPLPVPPPSAGGGSPTADSWEAEADDSLLTPDQDPDDDIGEVCFTKLICNDFLSPSSEM